MWRLRVQYADRLLLVVATRTEAELFFRRREALLREHQVNHLECWLHTETEGVQRGFTADLDASGQLMWQTAADEGDTAA
jgi:hypothetical protein